MNKKELLQYILKRVEGEEAEIQKLKERIEYHKGMHVQLEDMFSLIRDMNKRPA